jgi:hypothetical membrane protein
VPWWGVLSAVAAFVFLVGGCWLATALQPSSFNWLASTVSTLTERGTVAPWLMTAAFAVTGVCEVATALALRPAALPGRLILATGGAASVLVAANPEHAGGSLAHGLWAALTFTALTTWAAGAWRRGPSVPWGLRPAVSAAAIGVLVALIAWYLTELTTKGGLTGLAERVMGTAQVGWPLVVVLSSRPGQPGRGRRLRVTSGGQATSHRLLPLFRRLCPKRAAQSDGKCENWPEVMGSGGGLRWC